MRKNLRMSALIVELREYEQQYALIPRYDTEADVLVAESVAQGSWVHGINVDAVLIFDILASGRLASLELVWPRERWKTAILSPPISASRRATLYFSRATIAQKDFDLPVKVEKDIKGRNLRITLGRTDADASVVALSDRCRTLIDGHELLGFTMTLP